MEAIVARHPDRFPGFAGSLLMNNVGSDVLAPDEHPDIMGAARHRNLAIVEERLRVPQLRFDDEIAPRSRVESLPNGRRS